MKEVVGQPAGHGLTEVVKLTVPLNPSGLAAVIVELPVIVWLRASDAGFADIEKSPIEKLSVEVEPLVLTNCS